MNPLKFLVLVTAFLSFSCNQKSKKPLNIKQTSVPTSDDKEALQQLLRRMYEWHETKNSQHDLIPLKKSGDSLYIGIDLNDHKKRLWELQQTSFFTDRFINDYNSTVTIIDNKIRNKTINWQIGELPPFGNGANPWCNCQDNPNDYWKILTISKISINNNIATLSWTWGGDFEYRVKAAKQEDVWRIENLEGFDLLKTDVSEL